LWQNILDTQVNVFYTADNEKQVLININNNNQSIDLEMAWQTGFGKNGVNISTSL